MRALFPLLAACAATAAWSQPQLIDRVVAVAGTEAVLYSDIATAVQQARAEGRPVNDLTICAELEDRLFGKVLLDQARIDSVVVDEAQVQSELERRIRYFTNQIGSTEKLEEFYGKTITEIKDDFHDQVQEQLLVQTMQGQLTGGVRTSPRDVERFFASIPEDSLPLINAEVEFAQITKVPKASPDEDRRIRRLIGEYREAVARGEKDFCTVAVLYSQDPGSAANCGELGMVLPGTMVPEFDAVALSLKDGEVSQVFTTQFGYHFMQMIERRGEQYNARHVLMKPVVAGADLAVARALLDSLATRIRAGELDFAQAAAEYSDDEETRSNGGVLVEPNTSSPRWEVGDLDAQTFFIVDKLQPGQVGQPAVMSLPDGGSAYRLIKLLLRTDPHQANLKDDWQMMQQACEAEARTKAVDRWLADKLANTYVRVAPEYTTCPFKYDWKGRIGH
jgi:peptidyl-prolyl cis-trans isomerase SurA